MKILALLLFLAGGSAALAANDGDLLQNGDFSDGISHWEGDCHSVGSAVDDDSTANSGVIINLRSGDWVKISQDFEGKTGDYVLTVTYTVTPGVTFSKRSDDYDNTPKNMGLNGLSPFSTPPGDWCLVVVDTGIHMGHYWEITPSLDTSGVQTIRTKVELKSGDDFKKGFFLGFPPGNGTINLRSITLVPFGASSNEAQ